MSQKSSKKRKVFEDKTPDVSEWLEAKVRRHQDVWGDLKAEADLQRQFLSNESSDDFRGYIA